LDIFFSDSRFYCVTQDLAVCLQTAQNDEVQVAQSRTVGRTDWWTDGQRADIKNVSL